MLHHLVIGVIFLVWGIADVLRVQLPGVLARRLERRLSKQCKVSDDTAVDQLDAIIRPWKTGGSYRPYKAVGCVDCRMTGYMGRMGLYELLTVTEAFKGKVDKEPVIDALRRQAVQDGMRPLRLAGALRVAEGLTTLDAVLSTTPPLD